MDQKKAMSLRILKDEFEKHYNHPNPNIGVTVILRDQNDYYHWICSLYGPKRTPYEDGVFIVSIDFPEDFPYSKPEVRFITPIYHLNVCYCEKPGYIDKCGHVCLSVFNNWDRHTTVNGIFVSLFGLFFVTGYDSPYGIDRTLEFKENRDLFNKKIKYFTEKYAKVGKTYKDYVNLKNWDFTYNPNKY